MFNFFQTILLFEQISKATNNLKPKYEPLLVYLTSLIFTEALLNNVHSEIRP